MEGGKMLEMFEVGPCEDAYQMGFLIGQRFKNQIRSRLESDLIHQNKIRPFAKSPQSQTLIQDLSSNTQKRFPRYWDELVGLAEGSGVDALDIILINFRKEILAFLLKSELSNSSIVDNASDDCSEVLVVSDSMAIAAHNEDANVALVGHTYLIKGALSNGLTFIAYKYAGELPSCAFGFNSHGLAFTLNSIPPMENEIMAGGVGRNFISRDLLEATSIEDAINKIPSSEVCVGRSYNLIETRARRIVSVETASRNRISVCEIGETPYFHANMYLHLQVPQVQYENSISRERKAAVLPKSRKEDFLAVLGDSEDPKHPIYTTGPILYTLCTTLIDMDQQALSIFQGNPQKGEVYNIFDLSSKDHKLL